MAIIGYARVSTTDQDEALQVDDLQAAGADRLAVQVVGLVEARLVDIEGVGVLHDELAPFIDKASGVSARPELERAWTAPRPAMSSSSGASFVSADPTRDLLQRVDSIGAASARRLTG